MVSQSSSAALQRQMRSIRRDLNEHADQMVEKARRQFDWRHFVAKRPWLSLAAAVAAGYVLVPRRTCCKGVDAQTVKETVHEVVRASQPASQPASSSLVRWLVTLLATTLVREGVAIVPQLARGWLTQGSDAPQGNPTDGNGRWS